MRISVTDRCNLRCTYCMPADGVDWIPHSRILSFEEIVDVVKAAAKLGIHKIRLTGGEPLIRKGIVDLVASLYKIEGIKEVSLTTNGILLPKYAEGLYKAGMRRLNISLDSLDAKKYHKLTRLGQLEEVLAGIDAAKKVGFSPIKINMVINPKTTNLEKESLREFCNENDLQLRMIHEMDLEEGSFSEVEGGEGGNCALCNRIRLTSQGDIVPCLFGSSGYNVRELGAETAIRTAIGLKPENGKTNQVNSFYNIGG